jgi:hypothetical protein
MKVLVCGSRKWGDWKTLESMLSTLPDGTHIIEGGAQGADTMARQFAIGRKWPYTEVKADWKKYGPSAGPIRNRVMLDMLDKTADKVMAFFASTDSPGTKDTVREATDRGIHVETFFSTGS